MAHSKPPVFRGFLLLHAAPSIILGTNPACFGYNPTTDLGCPVSDKPTLASDFARPYWNRRAQQWEQKIGYHFIRDSRTCEIKRDRRVFRFGRDENRAIAESVDRQRRYEAVVKEWPRWSLQVAASPRVAPDQLDKPVWPEGPVWEELAASAQTEVADLADTARELEVYRQNVLSQTRAKLNEHAMEIGSALVHCLTTLDDFEDPHAVATTLLQRLVRAGILTEPEVRPYERRANPTLVEAKDLYLGAERERVGRALNGMTPSTYKTRCANLDIALGLSTSKRGAPKAQRKPIDLALRLSEISKDTLQDFFSFWMNLPAGVGSSRTAKNYCSEFHRFLVWCSKSDRLAFSMPAGADDIFSYRGAGHETVIARYQPAILRDLLASASQRGRLFILLGLNCGMYQQDISDLMSNAILDADGRLCLWWLRSKERGKRHVRVLTPLWDETRDLLMMHRAPANPHRRLLLNERGFPLVRNDDLGTPKADAITPTLDRAKALYARDFGNGDEPSVTFRQFRKITKNEMKRKGDSVIAKLWAGQHLSGVDFNYDDMQPDDFLPVFGPLDAVAKQFREDGVFDALKAVAK